MRIPLFLIATLMFGSTPAFGYEMTNGASNAIATLILIAENTPEPAVSLTPGQRKILEEKVTERHKKLEQLTPEQRAKWEARRKEFEKLSPEVREELRAHHQRMKQSFDNLSPEAKNAIRQHRQQRKAHHEKKPD